MGILAEQVDHVIGVDTHRDSHSAAIVASGTGAVVDDRTVPADAMGYKRLLRFARFHAKGRRAWAIESSGSFGAGLTAFLLSHGEWVVEVERPVRLARRNGAKSDHLDAIRAAHEALSRKHLAQPRRRGDREAIRVLMVTRRGAMRARTRAINHLKALVVTSREELRHQLRRQDTDELIARCARLRTLPKHTAEHRATVIALRHTARRILMLEAEANDLESEIEQLIKANVPWLLDEIGVGPITAAQLFCSWSHPHRLRNDGAFAMLGGAAPIPASSGQTIRYRLNRGGDRQANNAIHTIAIIRAKHQPATRAYLERRITEGKTKRESLRSLKRHISRELYQRLTAIPLTS